MTSQPVSSFGDLVRRARRSAGLTQEELAERAGIGVRTISDLERGASRVPHQETLELLAGALKLSTAELASWQRARLLARAPRPNESSHFAGERPALARSRLPAPLNSLIGRARECAAIVELLQEGRRLVTITGPGGGGKTRLAIAVAHEVADHYRDGVWFIDLAPLGDSDLVLPEIAVSVGIPVAGDRPIVEVLAGWFSGNQALLVLDNVEHLLGVASSLSALLAAAPQLAILSTSRVPLRIGGEQEFALTPLELPGPDAGSNVKVVEQVAAVALFVQRVREMSPDFRLTSGNVKAVTAICQRVDGLPLGIELAAAWVRVLPPQLILQRLDRGLAFLASPARDAPARHRTLHDAVAWSYDLLDPAAQKLFRRAGVFRGSWGLEAASAVGGHDGVDEAGLEIVNELETLAAHSLIQHVVDEESGEPRYRMLETIREFSLERLRECAGIDEVWERHARYYAALVRRTEPQPGEAVSLDWLRQMAIDLDNLRAALAWGLQHDAELTLRIAASLQWFWLQSGLLVEGLRWLESGIEAKPDAQTATRARALGVAGILAGWQGNTAYALQLLHEHLRLLRQHDDRRDIAWALLDLGRTHELAGNFELARQVLDECLSLVPEAGDRQLEGFVLGTYGTVLRFLGNPDDAIRHVEMAIAIADDQCDIRARAIWLYNLGYIEAVLGKEDAARRHLRDGLRAARSISDSRFVIECLDGLAVTMLDQEPQRAARIFGLVAMARTSISYPVFAGRKSEHDQQLARLIDALGEEPFAREWDRGARLSLDAAITLALADA